jgi:hypothetical protein
MGPTLPLGPNNTRFLHILMEMGPALEIKVRNVEVQTDATSTLCTFYVPNAKNKLFTNTHQSCPKTQGHRTPLDSCTHAGATPCIYPAMTVQPNRH